MSRLGRRFRLVLLAVAVALIVGCTPGGGGSSGPPAAPGASPSSGGDGY